MFKRLLVLGALAGTAWYVLKRRGRGGEQNADERPEEGLSHMAEPATDSSGAEQSGGAGKPAQAGTFASGAATPAPPVAQQADAPTARAGSGIASSTRGPDAGPRAEQPQTAAPPTKMAAASTTSAAAATRPTAEQTERRIKGNNRGDEKLYHLPNDETYDQVIEERLFATREEAEAAGYHHARQPG